MDPSKMHPFTFSNTVLSNTECVLLAIVMVSIIALTTNIVFKDNWDKCG